MAVMMPPDHRNPLSVLVGALCDQPPLALAQTNGLESQGPENQPAEWWSAKKVATSQPCRRDTIPNAPPQPAAPTSFVSLNREASRFTA